MSILQRIRRALCSHACYLYRHDGTPNLHRRPDELVEMRCHKCGAVLVGDYGLQISGFKMGTEPHPPK
jgi:hypothetical protein